MGAKHSQQLPFELSGTTGFWSRVQQTPAHCHMPHQKNKVFGAMPAVSVVFSRWQSTSANIWC